MIAGLVATGPNTMALLTNMGMDVGSAAVISVYMILGLGVTATLPWIVRSLGR
ncbi:hypothetical protein [Streptomyces aureus]|uniref:hypothetical protein n=1 Tax=Streptomyces aureus TaxID=193461 RepID=UPI0033D0B27B